MNVPAENMGVLRTGLAGRRESVRPWASRRSSDRRSRPERRSVGGVQRRLGVARRATQRRNWLDGDRPKRFLGPGSHPGQQASVVPHDARHHHRRGGGHHRDSTGGRRERRGRARLAARLGANLLTISPGAGNFGGVRTGNGALPTLTEQTRSRSSSRFAWGRRGEPEPRLQQRAGRRSEPELEHARAGQLSQHLPVAGAWTRSLVEQRTMPRTRPRRAGRGDRTDGGDEPVRRNLRPDRPADNDSQRAVHR